MSNPYDDYYAPYAYGDPVHVTGAGEIAIRPPARRHWVYLDAQGRLDSSDCVELGGHCWEAAGNVVLAWVPEWHERCRHCPATRVGVRQEPMVWTTPAGQP